jgi:hypothetical protein
MIFDPLHLVANRPGLPLGRWASAPVRSTSEPMSHFLWRAGLIRGRND